MGAAGICSPGGRASAAGGTGPMPESRPVAEPSTCWAVAEGGSSRDVVGGAGTAGPDGLDGVSDAVDVKGWVDAKGWVIAAACPVDAKRGVDVGGA